MSSGLMHPAPVQAPPGYAAVPLESSDQTGSGPGTLRLAVLVRTKPDDIAGPLVALRETMDSRAVLGCVVDAAGNVARWIEIWVQDVSGLAGSASAAREALNNAVLDRLWRRRFEALRDYDPAAVITTGWEGEHPPPLWLDASGSRGVAPIDREAGAPWRLCTDDSALAKAGLPAFTTSLHRYLYLPELGGESRFVPVTPDAPANARTLSLADIAPGGGCVPLNPGGGFMLAREFNPIELERFIDVLGGADWAGLSHGRSLLPWRQPHPIGGAPPHADGDNGSLFLGRHGRWGRLVESLHLKLRLLGDAVDSVRAAVEHLQAPLLNVNPESFSVRQGPAGVAMPVLWGARLALVDLGDAVALPIPSSDLQYFTRAGLAGMSVYQPDAAGQICSGRGSVRIRKILNVDSGIVVEGTLVTQERMACGRNDLLWIRLNIAGERVDLYSTLDAEAALARGEVRFRTVAQRFNESVARSLTAAEGVPIAGAAFELLPLLSSPCDLYALAVLAVRLLLVNPQNSLPVALDEVLSLGRQLAQEHDPNVGMELRIRSVFDGDPRWAQALGPHRLLQEQIDSRDAFDLVPADVWWSTLALVVRMFAGLGPDSYCRDYGDASPGALHKVFEAPLADLQTLLIRTRSLIVIDWRFNREIHAVIRRYAAGLASEAAPA